MGQPHTVNLPVVGGVDEKTAQEWLDPTQRVAAIVNGNAKKQGASDKRLGMGHLSTALAPGASGTAPTTANRVTSWSKQNLALMAPGALYSYTDAEGALTPVGTLPACAPLRRPISTGPTSLAPVLCDFPAPNGTDTLRMAVYQDPANFISGNPAIGVTVYDLTTGDIILEPTTIYTSTSTSGAFPLAVFYQPTAPAGEQVVVTILDLTPSGAGNTQATLWGMTFSPITNTFSAKVALVGDTAASGIGLPAATPYCDVAPWLGDPSGRFIVATNGGTSFSYVVFLPNLTAQSNAVIVTTHPAGSTAWQIYCYASFGANARIWFYYAWHNTSTGDTASNVTSLKGDGTFTTVLAINPVATLSAQAFWLVAPVPVVNAQTIYLGWFQVVGSGSGGQLLSWNGSWELVNDSGIIAGGPYPIPLGCFPVARPFAIGDIVYLPCIFTLYNPTGPGSGVTHSQQGTLYLLRTVVPVADGGGVFRLSMLPIATVAPRQVDLTYLNTLTTAPGLNNYEPWTSASSGTRYAVGIRTVGQSFAGKATQMAPTQPSWACDFLFDTKSQALIYQSNEFGQELHISGGVPMIADGASVCEDNFFYYPEFSYVTQTGSGSSLTGTYSYAVCYAFTDAAGKLTRSVPAFTGPITLGGGANPTVNVPGLAMTWRDVSNPGQVFAEIYRTYNNGSTFGLVDRILASGDQNTVYLNPYVDTTPDASVETATILYTTGGVVDQPCPPAAAMQCVWIGRLWIVDETLRNVWFTQQDSAGLLAGWNEAFTFALADGGDMTAIGGLNSYLVLWKASSIWTVSGQNGPSATAQGSDLTSPQKITSDVGCISWPSVCLCPQGYLFQSQSGIYLLDQGLNVTFVGKAVQDTLALYPTITSATLVPSTNHVRFSCTSANGTTSIVIVYDYLLQEWHTYTYGQITAPIADSCIDQNGRFAFATTDGNLWREKPVVPATAYCMDDDVLGVAHFVPQTVTWGWVQAQSGKIAYNSFRKVQFFGERLDDCGLTMSFAVNYDPTIVQAFTWASTNLTDIQNDLVEAWVAGCYRKGVALQVSVSDAVGAATVTGQGARFVSINVDADDIGMTQRQVAAARRA